MEELIHKRRRFEKAVRERTGELEMQKNMGERQKRGSEELLRQSQGISRRKCKFLANLSHEIRTPMNSVIGMAQRALDTSLDAGQRDYAATVRDSVAALTVVIDGDPRFLGDRSREAGSGHQPFPIRNCVADALMGFAWKAQENISRCCSASTPRFPTCW
jgi:signal transduction histidine kinase